MFGFFRFTLSSTRRRVGAVLGGSLVASYQAFVRKTSANQEEELELVQVQIIARHGVRTPYGPTMSVRFMELDWRCEPVETNDPTLWIVAPNETIPYDEYKKTDLHSYGKPKVFGNSCVDGQLTLLGMEQMENFGKALRERYVNQLSFLEEKFNENDVWIRSTNTSRTILTARQVIRGLYPSPTRSNNDAIKLHVLPKDDENMYPRSTCKKFVTLKKNSVSSNKEGKEKFSAIMSKLEDDKDYWNTRSIAGFTNNLNAMVDHEFFLPKNLTNADFEDMLKISGMNYVRIYENFEARKLGIGRFVEQLLKNVEAVVGGKKNNMPKMFIYSGHDNTLVPLLNSLEVFDGYHPRMGTAVILELWKNQKNDYFFQILTHKPNESFKILQMPRCTSHMCQISNFLDQSQKLIPQNYIQECALIDDD